MIQRVHGKILAKARLLSGYLKRVRTHFRPQDVISETQLRLLSAANEAGLLYVDEEIGGYSRKKVRGGFKYFDARGRKIRDKKIISRINHLAIPPAYVDVWICPHEKGHIQATARDARGRKQYRYHDQWRLIRDANKYERMIDFVQALPQIRKVTHGHLGSQGLPRQKVLAAVVQLLEKTYIRVGNEEYARENDSFGLTTLRNRHVEVRGSKIHFEFRGKSKVDHVLDIRDRRLAQIIRNCQDLPGQELFQFVDESGECHRVGSDDVNLYLQEITGQSFTAKDFRTWAGTVMAILALRHVGRFKSERDAKQKLNVAVKAVALRLGNTAAICRKCYIHPAVLTSLPKKLKRRWKNSRTRRWKKKSCSYYARGDRADFTHAIKTSR